MSARDKLNARIGLTGLILTAAFLAGCMPQESATGHFDRTFAVNGPVRLEIANGSGNTRVTAGSPGEVSVHAQFRVRAWSLESAERRLREIEDNPPVLQESNLIRVGNPNWHWIDVDTDYTITAPPDTELRAVAGSGNVEVSGVQGPANFIVGSGRVSATEIANDVRAIVGSGNVRLVDMGGEVDVTAGSGNVQIDGSKGEIRARAGSGEVRLEQPADTVEAQTGSGDIRVTGATADLRLRAASGEIRVDGNPGATNFWDLHTASGSVRLSVPHDASFRFYARTNSGDIDVGVPTASETSGRKHDYQARIGDGKARVEVETVSGDISVR